MNYRRRWLLLIPLAALLALAWDRCCVDYWVGHADLELIFDVRDHESGQPIEGTKVEVREENWAFKKEAVAFQLATGPGGSAKRDCPELLCSGVQSALGFTDSYSVCLPWWQFRVVAPGREPTPWMDLHTPDNGCRVERLGTGRARLTLSARLARARP